MDSIGRARGRGRVLTENLSISKDETTRPFNFSRVTSASCQSSEEKIDRANAAPVIISAPRGKGVGRFVSEFPSLRISERANSSGRGTPWSNCSLPKTKPSHIEDKRGSIDAKRISPEFVVFSSRRQRGSDQHRR